jgi:hypothetical protein
MTQRGRRFNLNYLLALLLEGKDGGEGGTRED